MAAESSGVPSSYFANLTFSPYCFGSALNSASSVFLGMGSWNLIKVIFMYPEIEISMVTFL